MSQNFGEQLPHGADNPWPTQRNGGSSQFGANAQPGFGSASSPPHCPRHPERIALVRCQRCDRPVCPDCQVNAAVGVQCVDCLRRDPQRSPMASVLGAPLRGGKPVVTLTVIVLCVVVYLLQDVDFKAGTGDCATNKLNAALALVPRCAPEQPYRFLTSGFVHIEIVHLLFNMYALWVVGSFLEPLLGRLRYAALFILSVLGGAVAVGLYTGVAGGANWNIPTVGASGGVFGLFGAMVWVARRIGADMRGIMVILGINLVFSFIAKGISWQGHLGGLVIGLALGAAYAFASPARRKMVNWLATSGAAFVLVALATVVTQLRPA
ncbi:MAG: rhomboid family intramembrane serine protease [Bifidobacteriaceae bacterium]|nr:rhomboid family intramembrane serine protease [Bifidobacteriaceae bacterium]